MSSAIFGGSNVLPYSNILYFLEKFNIFCPKVEIFLQTDYNYYKFLRNEEFVLSTATDFLGKFLTVKVDRPLGSKHPKYDFIYPINYGYIPNTISGDGEELDAYILGVNTPVNTFYGKCIAIIHRLNDNDDKLVIVPENKLFSDSEIEVLTDFQEQYFEHVIIR